MTIPKEPRSTIARRDQIGQQTSGPQLPPGTEVRAGARILKVLAIDSQTGQAIGAYPSKQVTDPFSGVAGYGAAIRLPPLDFEQLVLLAEAHPIHAASIEQKVTDIVATGLDFSPLTDGASVEQKTDMLKWWESLFEEFTSLELLQAMWNDFETLGWGAFEISRDIKGIVRRLYHIPGHTLRAHSNGFMFPQMRMGRIAWFKAWGMEEQFSTTSGQRLPDTAPVERRANEILVFRKPARRSNWYGIPVYVSGLGHLAMAVAARDFNIKFFDNYREPRHMIIVSGLAEDVDSVTDDIENVWKTQLKDQPHHNIFIPISGDARVTVERLGLPINDMHFARLMEQVDGEILVSHRMPPDRIGASKRGFLGGSVAQVLNSIYKEGVVSKGQAILESRLDRFIRKEYALAKSINESAIVWKPDFEDLDIVDEGADIVIGVNMVSSNAFTLNEVRERLGYARHEPFADMTLTEYLAQFQAPAAVMSATRGLSQSSTQQRVNTEVLRRLEDIDTLIYDLLGQEAGDVDQTFQEAQRNGRTDTITPST